jgi:hypothetical protein
VVDLDKPIALEHRAVDHRRVEQQGALTDLGHRRLEMQATPHRGGNDFVTQRRHQGAQLRHSRLVGAFGPTDPQRASQPQHVATVECGRRLDIQQPAMGFQCRGDRGGLRSPGLGSRPGDNRRFVQHHGGVFDKDRVGQQRLGG